MENIFNTITLIVLFIFSIREIIAKNFDLPLPKRYKWLVYNKKMQEPVLCSRAYDRMQSFNEGSTIKSIIERILIVAGKHIKKFDDGYFHRKKFATEIRSKYFINTLEASYDDVDLDLMTKAIQRLIEESGLYNIDFVLFLKNGNHLLAQSIFKSDRTIIYICKIDEHSSYVPKGTVVPMDYYSIQYENLDRLLSSAMAVNNEKKLTGVAIDCSISTGEGLKDSISHFNELLTKNPHIKVNKIQHAFVLYCHKDFEDANATFKLHRYFDMDEDIREMIFNEVASADNKGVGARKVYEKLKEKKRLHRDL